MTLDLAHAGTVALRIAYYLAEVEPLQELLQELVGLLEPYRVTQARPNLASVRPIQARAAQLGRLLVAEIQARQLGHDRLGQCIRNLFECLELATEGAQLSLLAGENPNSLQRPY